MGRNIRDDEALTSTLSFRVGENLALRLKAIAKENDLKLSELLCSIFSELDDRAFSSAAIKAKEAIKNKQAFTPDDELRSAKKRAQMTIDYVDAELTRRVVQGKKI